MSSPAAHRPSVRSGHLATLLSAGAGLAAFCFYLLAVTFGGTLAPLDGELLSLSRDVAARIPRGAVARVSELGGLPVATLLVVVAAAVLAVTRRPGAAVALALGFVAVLLAVDLLKEEVARPRPPTSPAAPATDSFPSGHAAYATAWTAVAVTLARLHLMGLPRRLRVAAVSAGLAVTALVGLTRIVLGVHYWSDVVGGWGLGLALFALAAVTASSVTSMRHTERRTGTPDPGPRSTPP